MSEGKFLVLDGAEGCGKSTQAKRLWKRLLNAGRKVAWVRDPGTTVIGEKIRGILLDPENTAITPRCEMLLFMAARAQMMSEIILPALRSGTDVISDRFVSSTFAYQMGLDGISYGEIHSAANTAIQGRWPDLSIMLDISLHDRRQRVRAKFQGKGGMVLDRIEIKSDEYHATVAANYRALTAAPTNNCILVNGARSADEVGEEIWNKVAPLLVNSDTST